MSGTVVFSTKQLPLELDANARRAHWQNLYAQNVVSYDVAYSDAPFAASFEARTLNSVTVCRVHGTINRTIRASRHIAADNRDEFMIGFNESGLDISISQRGRQASVAPRGSLFFTSAECFDYRSATHSSWIGLCVPRKAIEDIVRNADDVLLSTPRRNSETLRHLRRYILSLLRSDAQHRPDAVLASTETTLLDLIALSFGAPADVAALASWRGLRAARLGEVVAGIGHGYIDRSFSLDILARNVGLAPRYIQYLLEESGTSFSEHVIELRMQRAIAMLGNRKLDLLRVSDIALDCGFNDVSYFNRCFRRRFGCSPSQYRRAN